MGNCIDSERLATTWVDEEDEWESESPSWRHESQRGDRIGLLSRSAEEEVEEENRRKRTPTTTTTKIKIKVSKKQLEELLRQVNGERVAFRRMLADLASESSREILREQEGQARHWTPELQSIPEVPE